MTDTRRRNRRLFWVLVALFFGPLALSFAWYYGFEQVRPDPAAQHGTLILPPRPLPAVSLPTADGATDEDFLVGYWSMVTFARGECDEACRQTLLDLRQLRTALGTERTRVRQVFLHAGPPPDAEWLASQHPLLLVASLDHPDAAELLQHFDAGDVPHADTVWLVDPLGNLMMRYDDGRTLRGMHDDLKRLLRLSHIG